MDSWLEVGELAQRAGMTMKATRFDEAKRVLPPAKRATGLVYPVWAMVAMATSTAPWGRPAPFFGAILTGGRATIPHRAERQVGERATRLAMQAE